MSASGADGVAGIRAVLDGHGELLGQALAAGARLAGVGELAERWARADYDAEAVELWCAARCAVPEAARLLGNLSIGAAAAGRAAKAAGVADTLGFLVAAGLLSDPAGILVVAGVSTLLIDEPTALRLAAGQERAVELATTAAQALEQLCELLDSSVLPSAVNDVVYRATEAIGYASIAVERCAARSIGALADYLEHRPPHATICDRDAARDLAERLHAYGETGTTLHHRARDEFFGSQEFNPSGFAIRIAIKDGRSYEEFLDEHDRKQRER